jgi:Succinylglutamate desuccinylase / Aspartoacylase family
MNIVSSSSMGLPPHTPRLPPLRLARLNRYRRFYQSFTFLRDTTPMREWVEDFLQENTLGVPGVLQIDSGKPGPISAILGATHGNEIGGIEALLRLRKELRPECGSVLLILVNPEAARENKRYLTHNMNRLPDTPSRWAGTNEGERLAALIPLLEKVNGAVIDLHSTSADAPPMLISLDAAGCEAALCPSLPFDTLLSGIAEHLSGKAILEYFPKAPLRLLAECGQHHALETVERAVAISLCLLRKSGNLPLASPLPINKPVTHYHVIAPMHLPRDASGFRLLSPLAPFEWVEKGQPIACNGSTQALAPESGWAIMCPKTDGLLDAREALLFLCRKES